VYTLLTIIFAALTVLSSYSTICTFTHTITSYNVHSETVVFALLSLLNGYLGIKKAYVKLPTQKQNKLESSYIPSSDSLDM
jgi:hypothetical protein